MGGNSAVSASNIGRHDVGVVVVVVVVVAVVVLVAAALGEESFMHGLVRKPEGKDQSEDIGLHIRIILKCILKKLVRRV